MWRYEVLIDLDDEGREWEDKKGIYFAFAEKYNAACFGNSKKRNSRLVFISESVLSRKDLEKDLSGIRLIEVRKEELREVA